MDKQEMLATVADAEEFLALGTSRLINLLKDETSPVFSLENTGL